MKPELVIQITTLIILLLMAFFQVRNFIKYRQSDESNKTRVILMITTLAFIIHTLRMIFDYTQGYFFAVGILGYLYLYMQDWIKQMIERFTK